MKRIVLTLIITAGLLGTVLFAQSTQKVEITAEPHHHQTLANREVRVFTAEVPPHSETLTHWHRHDYIYVALGECKIVNTIEGKGPVTLTLQGGDTRFVVGGFAHASNNVSDRPLRIVVVELLQDEKLRRLPTHGDERALDILHGGTKEVLWVKDGVRASMVELQPGGMMPVPGRAALVVGLGDVELQSGKSKSMPLKTGETRWFEGSHDLMNTGLHLAKFVTLEFTQL
jgi:hypothetical protein